jgi:hypothetical protein
MVCAAARGWAEEARPTLERLASQLKFLSTNDVLYDRLDNRAVGKEAAAEYKRLLEELFSAGYPTATLVELLKHSDPKVRTLAMAALFVKEDPKILPHLVEISDDISPTFPSPAPWARVAGPIMRGTEMPPMQKQTVGQIAEKCLRFYLQRAGYNFLVHEGRGKREFAEYWAARKDRQYCASWFAVQLARAIQGTTPPPKSAEAKVEALRKRIDDLPKEDRAWTLLWLHGDLGGQLLISDSALISVCQELGPEKLLLLLKRNIPSTDPDLQPRKINNFQYHQMIFFVLKHAKELLRDTDADELLARARWEGDYGEHGLSDPLITPWWAIAAAELLPVRRAGEVLSRALRQFDGEADGHNRADIKAAQWPRQGSYSVFAFVDWFYREQRRGDFAFGNARTRFLEAVTKDAGDLEKRLVATIILDRRFKTLDYPTVTALNRVVSRWADKPSIIDPETLQKVHPPLGVDAFYRDPIEVFQKYPDETLKFLKELDQCREELRKSVPLWFKEPLKK